MLLVLFWLIVRIWSTVGNDVGCGNYVRLARGFISICISFSAFSFVFMKRQADGRGNQDIVDTIDGMRNNSRLFCKEAYLKGGDMLSRSLPLTIS